MLLMSVLSLPPTASPHIADIQWCPDIKLIKCSDWAEYTTSIRPYNTQILIITRISTTKLIFRNIDIDQVFHIYNCEKRRKITCLCCAVSDIFCFYHHFNVYWYSVEKRWTHYKDWSQHYGWIHSDRTLQISCLLLAFLLSTPLRMVLDTFLSTPLRIVADGGLLIFWVFLSLVWVMVLWNCH